MPGSRPGRAGSPSGSRRRETEPVPSPSRSSGPGRGGDGFGEFQASAIDLFRANAEAGWAWWSAVANAPSPEAAWRDGARITTDAFQNNVDQVRLALDAAIRLLDDPPARQNRADTSDPTDA